jgi:hypothetical protein
MYSRQNRLKKQIPRQNNLSLQALNPTDMDEVFAEAIIHDTEKALLKQQL